MKHSSIEYKGYRSPTLHLTYLGFTVGTLLLLADIIDAKIWEVSVLGLIANYVIANGMSKASEAYVAARAPALAPPSTIPPGHSATGYQP